MKRSGGRLYWHCLFHDDHDPSFSVNVARQLWGCYPCGLGGDAAALVMKLERMTFPEAVAYLTGETLPIRRQAPGTVRPRSRRTEPAPPSGMPEPEAVALVESAAARLWAPDGEKALAYLRARGITDATARAARLGVTPPLDLPGKPRGVVLAWFAAGRPALVKVRQPEGTKPKYREVFRDPARLVCYPGLEVIAPGRPLIIVEGEFDALLLGQELGTSAAVVTLGTAAARPGPDVLNALLPTRPWYIATDGDDAGDTAAARWADYARRVRPPGEFKDWTEAWQAGVNLRRWWAEILDGNDRPALFIWEELKPLRWGPAIGDPTPGIDLDHPKHLGDPQP